MSHTSNSPELEEIKDDGELKFNSNQKNTLLWTVTITCVVVIIFFAVLFLREIWFNNDFKTKMFDVLLENVKMIVGFLLTLLGYKGIKRIKE